MILNNLLPIWGNDLMVIPWTELTTMAITAPKTVDGLVIIFKAAIVEILGSLHFKEKPNALWIGLKI
jgi:hypothetical protein